VMPRLRASLPARLCSTPENTEIKLLSRITSKPGEETMEVYANQFLIIDIISSPCPLDKNAIYQMMSPTKVKSNYFLQIPKLHPMGFPLLNPTMLSTTSSEVHCSRLAPLIALCSPSPPPLRRIDTITHTWAHRTQRPMAPRTA
jgi:hypothetical protein